MNAVHSGLSDRRLRDLAAFLAPPLVWVGASIIATRPWPAGTSDAVFAAALTADLTIMAPGLVYLLLVRPGRLPKVALLPAFVLGLVLAEITIPAQQQQALGFVRWLLAPAEIGVVLYLVLLTRRTLKGTRNAEGDFVERLRTTARSVIQSRIPADILTTETSVLYHFFSGRAQATNERQFTVHRESGYLAIMIAFVMAIFIETVAVHFLVALWSPLVAWVLTGLSAYTLLWLIGDYRALNKRPIEMTDAGLKLRVGLRWESEEAIPYDQLLSAERCESQAVPSGEKCFEPKVWGEPDVELRFSAPVQFAGMYGLQKQTDRIRLRVDEVSRFLKALNDR